MSFLLILLQGAYAGFLIGLAATVWLGIGAQVYKPAVWKPPVFTNGCIAEDVTAVVSNSTGWATNFTTELLTTTTEAAEVAASEKWVVHILLDQGPFCGATDCPCFGLRVTLHMGFKARVVLPHASSGGQATVDTNFWQQYLRLYLGKVMCAGTLTELESWH